MGEAYRDEFGGPAAQQFAQHIGVAMDLVEEIERIPPIVEAAEAMTQDALDMLARRWAQGWERAWEQLGEARKIVVARGRDTSAFDAARAAAGDIWYEVAGGKAVASYNYSSWSWKSVSTQPAHDAIAALRAAMPEVVVVKQAPIDADLRPTSHKAVEILQVVGGVGVLAALAYFLYRAFS